VIFNDAVGNTGALQSLTVTGGPIVFTASGGVVNTTGSQSYSGTILLDRATTLTSLAGGNISLNGTVDGARALVIDTVGTTTFGGAVGLTTALTSITTNVGGTTAINGGSIITGGVGSTGQIYNDNVTLGAATTLTANNAAQVTFGGTVNGPSALTINSGGATTFGAAVGALQALASLTTDNAGTTVYNGGSITTTGAQIHGGTGTLGVSTTFTSTGGGNITFNNNVNGSATLAMVINTAGTTIINGNLGTGPLLGSFAVGGGGTTQLNAGNIFTQGAHTYDDAITLGVNNLLRSFSNGDIALNGTVSGAFGLTVTTGGTTTFGGAVSGLASLLVNGGGTTAINADIQTTGAQTYNDALTLGAPVTLTSSGDTITIGANVTGGTNALGFRLNAGSNIVVGDGVTIQ
jgi:hypothetical protein